MPTIEFLVEQKKIKVGKYSTLRNAARKHGIPATHTMEVVAGLENLNPKTCIERVLLRSDPDNIRLSCQAEVLGDVCVITKFTPKPSRQ